MRRLACLLALLICSPLSAEELPTASPAEVGLSSEKLKEADAVVEELIAEGRIAGAIVLVARHGEIAHFEAFGVRDLDSGEKMTKDTVIRIYSMTKPITSVAIMMLVEEGKIGLDDPVAKHLPEFAETPVYAGGEGNEVKTVPQERPVTVRDLLRHTSGLTYGIFGDTPVDQLYRAAGVLASTDTLAEMVGKLGKIPLLHQPGTRFHYSASTDVLGRIVEVASGQPLDQFFQERIFKPLDMKDTAFVVSEENVGRFASVHGRNEDGTLRVNESGKSSAFLRKKAFLSGGGGLTSTARDYARFCQMLLNKGELDGTRILKAETVAEMTTNQLPDVVMEAENGRDGSGFGLGFSVRVKPSENGTPGHVGEFGWGGAASTQFWISPADDLFVITIRQFQPYEGLLEQRLKPIVYDAITDEAP